MKKNLKPNVTCLLHVAIVYCAIAIGDMIESHFSHSEQWMALCRFLRAQKAPKFNQTILASWQA